MSGSLITFPPLEDVDIEDANDGATNADPANEASEASEESGNEEEFEDEEMEDVIEQTTEPPESNAGSENSQLSSAYWDSLPDIFLTAPALRELNRRHSMIDKNAPDGTVQRVLRSI